MDKFKEISERMGFIDGPEELKMVADRYRLLPLLVRCGGKRFVTSAQDAQDMIDMVEASDTDYIRDVAITVDGLRTVRADF